MVLKKVHDFTDTIKSPDSGKAVLTAEICEQKAYIRIKDTGMGIPKKEISRVFDRFYRCDASRSEPGIGVGLSLAKAIAESFKRKNCVDSMPQKGSIFIIILPC